MGLLNGIEFVPPESLRFAHFMRPFTASIQPCSDKLWSCECFVRRGFSRKSAGTTSWRLKAAPPLMVTLEQLDEFVSAIRDVVELAQTSPAFWTEALGMARRAVNI